jgi:hypothetical protein
MKVLFTRETKKAGGPKGGWRTDTLLDSASSFSINADRGEHEITISVERIDGRNVTVVIGPSIARWLSVALLSLAEGFEDKTHYHTGWVKGDELVTQHRNKKK